LLPGLPGLSAVRVRIQASPGAEPSFLNILSVDWSLVENADKDRATFFPLAWSRNEFVSQPFAKKRKSGLEKTARELSAESSDNVISGAEERNFFLGIRP